MPKQFNVTFERITDESAEIGDADSRGFVGEDLPLRAALSLVEQTLEAGVMYIEPSASYVRDARWLTWYGAREMHAGDFLNVSLHFPASLTGASRARIARLVGAR